ncbi:MAG: sigma-70 family RNA polymerase sigma factor, partial [Rhodothermales bacterium]
MDARDDTSRALEELCRRLTASDRSAFEEIFRRFRDDLVRYVRSVVKREAVAHDLVQDVFVSLWDTRRRLDPTKPLKAYIYRMARNAAYRHVRDTRTHERKHEILKRERNGHDPSAGSSDRELDAGMPADRVRTWIDN